MYCWYGSESTKLKWCSMCLKNLSHLLIFIHGLIFLVLFTIQVCLIFLISTHPKLLFGGNPILTAALTLLIQLVLPQWYSSVSTLLISIGPLKWISNNTHTLFLVWNPVTHHYGLGFQNILVSLTYRLRCDSDSSFLCIITDMVAMRFRYNLSDAV